MSITPHGPSRSASAGSSRCTPTTASTSRREVKVEANVGRPQVAYRETIRTPAEAEGRYIRQTGGRGQYGHVFLEVEPLPRGSKIEFVNKITGARIPREFIPPVEAGVREA